MTTKNGNGNSGSVRDKQVKFRKLYPQYGSIGATLKIIGIRSRTTFYRWLEQYPSFKKDYEEELKPNRIDALLSAAYEIALANRVKSTKHGIVVDGTNAQVTLIKYLLAVFDPEHYAEKYLMEHFGKGKEGEIIFKVVYEHSDKGKGISDNPQNSSSQTARDSRQSS